MGSESGQRLPRSSRSPRVSLTTHSTLRNLNAFIWIVSRKLGILPVCPQDTKNGLKKPACASPPRDWRSSMQSNSRGSTGTLRPSSVKPAAVCRLYLVKRCSTISTPSLQQASCAGSNPPGVLPSTKPASVITITTSSAGRASRRLTSNARTSTPPVCNPPWTTDSPLMKPRSFIGGCVQRVNQRLQERIHEQ